jgi:hypothetical protein
LLTAQFTFAQEEEMEVEATEETTWSSEEAVEEEDYTEKKQFEDYTYNELKKEVELVEEIVKRKLKSDSSEFGKGYGVEYGKDYYVYEYDSVTGGANVSEDSRSSGENFTDDGVRRNARNPNAYKRDDTKRGENQGRQGKLGKPADRTKAKPRADQFKAESGRDGNVGTFLLILFLAVVVGAIVYFLFINAPMEGASTRISYDKHFDPTKIELSELEIKIQEAEAIQDFRAATRYYFIWVMKELSDRNHISWKKKKTNYHYISEVASKPFNKDFSRTVNVFEYVWYGKYEIKQSEYNSVKREFTSLIEKLTILQD